MGVFKGLKHMMHVKLRELFVHHSEECVVI